MLSKGKMSQIRTGYKLVYGKNEVDDKDIVRIGNEIIFYAGRYDGETDEGMSKRFSSISALEDTDEISEFLASLPDDIVDNKITSTYGRLFKLGKDSKVSVELSNNVSISIPKEDSDTPVNTEMNKTESTIETPAITSVNTVTEDIKKNAVTIDNDMKNNNDNPEEEQNMEQNPVDLLKVEAEKLGAGVEVDGNSNVQEISKNDKDAAYKVVTDTQVDRINYSNVAKVKKVLTTSIDRTKKAMNGRSSMGTISDPKEALKVFISKTGCTAVNGVIEFSKLHSSQTADDAIKMYNLLKQAETDPSLLVKPYFGKEDAEVPINIKSIIVLGPDGKELIVDVADIGTHILRNGFLYLNVDSASEGQFQLDVAKSRAGVAPKKAFVVKIANKKSLLSDNAVSLNLKSISTEPAESKTGFKSDMSVTVNGSTSDAQGNPKKLTWRIPLNVDQYDVIIMPEYADLFKAGIGSVKPISAQTKDDLKLIIGKITSILAIESTKTAKGNILGSALLGKINEVKSTIMAESAEAVNDVLNGGAPAGTEVSDEDFEG